MNPNVDPSWGTTGAHERYQKWMFERMCDQMGLGPTLAAIRDLDEKPHPKGLE